MSAALLRLKKFQFLQATYFLTNGNAHVSQSLEKHEVTIRFRILAMETNQSLSRGLKVLLLYDGSISSLTISEISNRLGYSLSRTYRLARTLIQHGFLEENSGTAEYSLGISAVRIGLLARRKLRLPAIARPFMKELSSITKETVLLTALNGTKAICLERVESEQPIRYSLFQTGADLPLHCGASSKVLMAYLPEKEWDRIVAEVGLKRYTATTITEMDELKRNLREIRRKGYAFSDQEIDLDVRAVAAPVLNDLGQPIAGLSVAGPAYRIKKTKIPLLAKLTKEYAKKISAQSGWLSHIDAGLQGDE
jgi:DNA-binding IclR family transcriptional regulator